MMSTKPQKGSSLDRQPNESQQTFAPHQKVERNCSTRRGELMEDAPKNLPTDGSSAIRLSLEDMEERQRRNVIKDICKKASHPPILSLKASSETSFKLNGPSDGKGVDDSVASDDEPITADNAMRTTLIDDFVSFPPSSGRVPPIQIVNRGGTINISYNTYKSAAPACIDQHGTEADIGVMNGHEGRVSSPAHTHTCPDGSDPPLTKSTKPVIDDQPSVDHSHLITRSWQISQTEKDKLKDSIALMFMGDVSRRDLAKKLKTLGEAIRTERWDDKEKSYVSIELGPSSSGADFSGVLSAGLISPCRMDIGECAIKEDESSHGRSSDELATLSFRDRSFECDPSGLGIDAQTHYLGASTDRTESNEDEDDESDTESTGTVMRSDSEQNSSLFQSTQEIRNEAANTMDGEPSSATPGQKQYLGTQSVPAEFRRAHAAAFHKKGSQDTKPNQEENSTPPEVNNSLKELLKGSSKVVTFKLPEENKVHVHKSQGFASQTSGASSKLEQDERSGENKVTASEPDGVTREGQAPAAAPTAAGPSRILRPRTATQAPDELDLKGNNPNGPKTKQNPTKARKTGKHDTKTSDPQNGHIKNTSSKDTAQSNAPGQKVEKPRSKKPATEAKQCERDTDPPASSSTSTPATRRAAALSMLARVAGAAVIGPSTEGDHRDFSFLLPPPTETRKCRLCRKMFTDGSNVRQADGGAPCSYHPGVLEDKTGNNKIYTFSCCGGPPIMVGQNLVAMNLVSPGCTKCYHQDKRSAWNLETLQMKDPVLFEE